MLMLKVLSFCSVHLSGRCTRLLINLNHETELELGKTGNVKATDPWLRQEHEELQWWRHKSGDYLSALSNNEKIV